MFQVESDEFSSVCLPGGSQNDLSFLMFTVLPQGIQLGLAFFISCISIILCVIASTDKTGNVTTTATTTTLRKIPTELQVRHLSMNYSIFSFVYLLSAVRTCFIYFLSAVRTYSPKEVKGCECTSTWSFYLHKAVQAWCYFIMFLYLKFGSI